MPTAPLYGGTNGVPELDLGQPGSGRATSGDADYRPNVIERPPKFAEVENVLPQQMLKVVDHLGFQGQAITWEGTLRVKDDTVLAAILSDLYAAKTGHALSAGVFAAFDGSSIKVTRLANVAGRVQSEKARVKDFGFSSRQRNITTGGSTLTIALRLDVIFEVMG